MFNEWWGCRLETKVAIQNVSSAVTKVSITYEPNTTASGSDGLYDRKPLPLVSNITLTGDLGDDKVTITFNRTTADLNGTSPANVYLAPLKKNSE